MAINAYQPRQKKDALDVLAQGLGIASQVYGIKANMAALDDHASAVERAKQQDADKKNNVISGMDEAKLKAEGAKEVPEGTPGAIKYTRQDGSALWAAIGPKSELMTPYQAEQLKIEREKIASQERQSKAKTGIEKEPKPNQYQAATFGRRLEAAEDVFTNLQEQGYDRTKNSQGIMSALPGFVQPGQLKQQEQAERNFINAQLRRESGSAISPAEFDSAEKQYFPRPGDTPEVLAQKAQNRAIARQGLMKEAGKAWDEVGQIAIAPPKKSGNSGEAIAGDKGPQILTPEDKQAISWAKKNPKDPRSTQILQMHGMK